MFTLTTARLTLRDLLASDLPHFYALASHPDVVRFQTFIRCEDEAQAAEFLKNSAFYNAQQPRRVYNLAILRQADGAWLGWFGMGPPSDPTHGDLDFGYALLPQVWGQGYMREALTALLDFAFTNLPVNSIYAECDQLNPASARVMEASGMRLERTYDEVDEATGTICTMLRYRVLRTEREE